MHYNNQRPCRTCVHGNGLKCSVHGCTKPTTEFSKAAMRESQNDASAMTVQTTSNAASACKNEHLPMSFYVPGRSRSLPANVSLYPGTLSEPSGDSRNALGAHPGRSGAMSSDALGALMSRDALGAFRKLLVCPWEAWGRLGGVFGSLGRS